MNHTYSTSPQCDLCGRTAIESALSSSECIDPKKLRDRIRELEIAICELLVAGTQEEILASIIKFRILMRLENRT